MFLRQAQAVCGAVLAATLLVAASQTALSAQGDVTVYRGAKATTLHFPTSGALQIQRGTASKPVAYTAKADDEGTSRKVLAGERLWVIDSQANRLTTCALRKTIQVGRREIRCTTRDLPASLSHMAD